VQDRLWVNGTVRRWIVNKLTNAKNLDGSQALDDNTLKNYSGKVTASLSPNQKLIASYLWNDKIRGHRRDTPPNNVPDIAALVQTNPAQTTQIKYTGVRQRFVYESSFSIMDGQTNYDYQPGTPADAIRKVDSTLSTADFAAARKEEQPNSRHQFDNIFAYALKGRGGDHQLKAGVQFARLYWESRQTVQGDHWVEYANGVPNQVRQWNTPANPCGSIATRASCRRSPTRVGRSSPPRASRNRKSSISTWRCGVPARPTISPATAARR
jgi:hypothetical protein